MALWLRPTALPPPAHADRPDYLVIEDGETIGRIYDEGQYVPADIRWFWSITAFHVDPALGITTNGRVASLDEAKAQFRASWDKVRLAYKQKEQQPKP
jgi:hypothetical protein